MTISTTMDALRGAGIIAVLRAPSVDTCVRAVDALVKGGITGIEITYSTPDAPQAIAAVKAQHADRIVLGAGTIRTLDDVRTAVDAGADFLVSPGTDPELATAMVGTGLVSCLGAMTPSEVMAAERFGAHVIKVFPAALGGPSFLKALRGPFPDLTFMPTGGVAPDNLEQWFAAGAVAVGAGSDLCPPDAMATGDWALIEEKAAQFSAALAKVGVQ